MVTATVSTVVARYEEIRFPVDATGLFLPRKCATNHIALLNHPAVYERLREWLASPPAALALPAPAAG